MKIQHWAIIFIIIILPFSILARSIISKKNILLREETRYNNIIDNTTYDAISQIVEASDLLGYGKNIPITENLADAAIDRFFNTLSVNFNMPTNEESSKAYFSQYVPAIIIVGYDGLYVYSYEATAKGYDFVLKPKIPYACEYIPNASSPNEKIIINFTLDNYVKIYFSDEKFMVGAVDANGDANSRGTNIIEGYIGNFLDIDQNGINDLSDCYDETTGVFSEYIPGNRAQYTYNDDPFGIDDPSHFSNNEKVKYIKNMLPMFTDNLSYILKEWADKGSGASSNIAMSLDFLYSDDAKQDYEYDDAGNITVEASEFNVLRRNTIINLITEVLKQEFNEHNNFADTMGITYNFIIPEIGRDQWNNTIDDISVLAFFQGMPLGTEMYYNNYSLGGARIVQANYFYGEVVKDDAGMEHRIYHKHYCPLIPRDSYGIIYGEYGNYIDYTPQGHSNRITTGIVEIFINQDLISEETDLKKRFFICSECM